MNIVSHYPSRSSSHRWFAQLRVRSCSMKLSSSSSSCILSIVQKSSMMAHQQKKHRIWLYHIIWKKKQSKHGYIYIYLGFQSLSTANNLGCHWISRILLQKKVIISVGFMLSWALRLTPPWTKPAGEIHRWTEILSGWWLTYQPVVNILLIYG